jgi:hypothetical protein
VRRSSRPKPTLPRPPLQTSASLPRFECAQELRILRGERFQFADLFGGFLSSQVRLLTGGIALGRQPIRAFLRLRQGRRVLVGRGLRILLGGREPLVQRRELHRLRLRLRLRVGQAPFQVVGLGLRAIQLRLQIVGATGALEGRGTTGTASQPA